MQAANASGGGDSNARYTLSRDEPLTKVSTPNTSIPSPGLTITSPSDPSSLGLGSDASIDSIVAQWQADNGGGGGTGSKTKPPTSIPLWQVRPSPKKSSTGDDSISRSRRQKQAETDNQAKLLQQVPIAQAKAAYLDMSPEDRKKLRDKLTAMGEIDANDTEADVMNKWAQWVDNAVQYNTGKDPSEYISPWEALDKLGLKNLAGQGAGVNGTGYPHKVDDKSTTVQSFTLAQIQTAAEAVLQATLKRNPNKQELQRYLDAINQAAKDNPVVTHTTGTSYGPDQQSTTTTQSGGIDENSRSAIMLNMARQDPYYAETQAATTYFDAVMQALNSPINM